MEFVTKDIKNTTKKKYRDYGKNPGSPDNDFLFMYSVARWDLWAELSALCLTQDIFWGLSRDYTLTIDTMSIFQPSISAGTDINPIQATNYTYCNCFFCDVEGYKRLHCNSSIATCWVGVWTIVTCSHGAEAPEQNGLLFSVYIGDFRQSSI